MCSSHDVRNINLSIPQGVDFHFSGFAMMSSTFGGGGMDGGNFRSSSTSTRYQNGRKIVTQKYVFMRAFKNLEPLAYAHIFRLELPYL